MVAEDPDEEVSQRYLLGLSGRHGSPVEELGDVLCDGAQASIRDPLDTPAEGTAGLLSSYLNVTKSCLGVGVLAIPSAFALSGWLLGS
eukprot:scaffold146576_cov46-Prasinocladus_malaysianus.AAC.1